MIQSQILLVDLTGLKKNLAILSTKEVLLVSDENVWKTFGKDFCQWMGRQCPLFLLPSGDENKNLGQLSAALEYFLQYYPTRKSVIVALGGGVVTDFAGLVASLLLRGLSWWAIPTTLIGQVDAAIGGKVAVNSAYGKNLIGHFHAPEKVLIYHDFLESLPEQEWASGKGEILKYAFLDEQIQQQVMMGRSVLELIPACVSFKTKVVEQDPREEDMRLFLNLGHTFGHGLEVILGLPHGLAVAWGIAIVLECFIPPQGKNLLGHYNELTKALGLSLNRPKLSAQEFSALIGLIFQDKKRLCPDQLRVVTLLDIARPVLTIYMREDVEKKLANYFFHEHHTS